MHGLVRVIGTSLLIFAAACSHDEISGIRELPISANATAALATMGPDWQVNGENPFSCFLSMRAESGPIAYLYRVVSARFPTSALSDEGAVAIFRYRLESPEGEVLRVANCVIPATNKALRIIRQRLDVPDDAVQDDQGSALMSGDCVVKPGVCPVEGIVAIGEPTERTPDGDEPECSVPTDCYFTPIGAGSEGGGSGGGGPSPCLTCGPAAPILRCTGSVQRERAILCQVSSGSGSVPEVAGWTFQSPQRQIGAAGGSPRWGGMAVEGGTVTAQLATGTSLQATFAVTPRPWRWGMNQWSYTQGTAIICDSRTPGSVLIGWNLYSQAPTCNGGDNYRLQPDPRKNNNGWMIATVPDGPNQGVMYVDTITIRMDRASNINPAIRPGWTPVPLSGLQAQACGAQANFYAFNQCAGVNMQVFLDALWGHEGLGYGGGVGHESAARTAAVLDTNDPYFGVEHLVSVPGDTPDLFLTRIRRTLVERGDRIGLYAADATGNVHGNWNGPYYIYEASTGAFVQVHQSF
jgi:hypothetical protein